MIGDPVVHDVVAGPSDSAEKAGMRNAWGNIAATYDEMFAARMTHLTGRGRLRRVHGRSGPGAVPRPGAVVPVDDAERLSQPSDTFGAVTCSFGLMYCYDARSAVGHMARVLAPGGRLMVRCGAAPRGSGGAR